MQYPSRRTVSFQSLDVLLLHAKYLLHAKPHNETTIKRSMELLFSRGIWFCSIRHMLVYTSRDVPGHTCEEFLQFPFLQGSASKHKP